jgi:hypothetical protein
MGGNVTAAERFWRGRIVQQLWSQIVTKSKRFWAESCRLECHSVYTGDGLMIKAPVCTGPGQHTPVSISQCATLRRVFIYTAERRLHSPFLKLRKEHVHENSA